MEPIEVFADETVFRNDENGYTVLVVKSGKTRVSAVGIMPPIAPGRITLTLCEGGEKKLRVVTKKDPLWKRARKISAGESI